MARGVSGALHGLWGARLERCTKCACKASAGTTWLPWRVGAGLGRPAGRDLCTGSRMRRWVVQRIYACIREKLETRPRLLVMSRLLWGRLVA